MDFDDSPQEAAFRAQARSWLLAHAKPRVHGEVVHQLHLDPSPQADAEHVRRCKEWQRTLFDGGWAGLTWPEAFGGRGLSSTQQAIFDQEQAGFDVSTGVFAVGIGMVGPTLIAHGTEAQKERFLGPLLRGDDIWCQLFSEPGAGSDLASLSTKAERHGDRWVVNGQKVWTSGAHHSDLGILLARTNPGMPKHEGITYFVVEMDQPGIDVRPLHQINGIAHFNEVFLTDVAIPLSNVIGEVDDGWRVARTTLANERSLIGGGVSAAPFSDVIELGRRTGRGADPVIRQAVAQAYIRTEVLRYLGLRVRTAISHGRMPGPEVSVMKLAYSRHTAATADLLMRLSGTEGMLSGPAALDGGYWQQRFLGQWAVRIGGGTDQIQRNVIGERALGLPTEPRVDRGVPFRDLPVAP